MAGMYDVKGTEGDVSYSVEQQAERFFQITVSRGLKTLHESYNCQYPTLFGLDVVDSNNIEVVLDRLINEVKDSESPNKL